MSEIVERPFTSGEKAGFQAYAQKALGILNVPGFAPTPDEVVRAVNEMIDKWQERFRQTGLVPDTGVDTVDIALGLGAIWGDQLVVRFGWEWVCVLKDKKGLYAVASPDRAWVIYPTYFLRECLENPNRDCTAMLAFNMMAANRFPNLPAFGYQDVMPGVHRIVPKR